MSKFPHSYEFNILAAHIAAILLRASTPVPKYKPGVVARDEIPAMIGEGGAEIIEMVNGKVVIKQINVLKNEPDSGR